MPTVFFYKSKYHQKKTRIMEKGSQYSEGEREGEAKRNNKNIDFSSSLGSIKQPTYLKILLPTCGFLYPREWFADIFEKHHVYNFG
jgi:hypothetical protein